MTTTLLDMPGTISGDPGQIRSGASGLDAVADALDLTLHELRAARAGTGLCGEAVTAYLEAAEVITVELGAVHDRYRQTSAALRRYSASLESLQQEMQRVRAVAAEAGQRVSAAHDRVQLAAARSEEAAAQDLGSLEVIFTLPSPEERTAQDQLDAAVADLRRCEQDVDALLQEWHGAATRCAARIDEALASSGLNDSGWDLVCAGLETLLDDVLPDLEQWLDIIAIACTVLAIAAVLTGVGAGFAPALFAISRAAQAGARVVAIARTVATTTLVATGHRPVSDLVDLGNQMLVDRIGGKLTDAGALLAAKPLGALTSEGLDHASGALLAAERGGADGVAAELATHAVSIRAHGFDGWVRTVLDPKLTRAGAEAAASPAWLGTSATLHRLADNADSRTGPWGVLDGLTWQVYDVAREVDAAISASADEERTTA